MERYDSILFIYLDKSFEFNNTEFITCSYKEIVYKIRIKLNIVLEENKAKQRESEFYLRMIYLRLDKYQFN